MNKNIRIFMGMGIAVLLVLLFILLMPSKGYGINQPKITLPVTAQRAAEQSNTAKLIVLIYLGVLLLQTILFLLAKISLVFSNDFNKIIFFPFKLIRKKGKYRLGGVAEANGVPLHFAKVLLLDDSENYIDYAYTGSNGQFKFFVTQGSYIIQADKFGFEFEATKPVKIANRNVKDFDLVAKKTEDAIVSPPLLSYFKTGQAIWLFIILFGLVCSWFIFPFMGRERTAFVAVATIISIAIYISNRHSYMTFYDKKGKKMVDSEFEISDHKGDKIVTAKTDKNGKVKLIASPGFYKVRSNKTLTRTFKISAKEIVDLELKV